ncbi:MAG: TonB-dependent receptor plug domain-containing protein [Bacteroidales bacterium]|nr:TonB-dependent receptor plug domain-containing protein [Bacteroidales bacterium]
MLFFLVPILFSAFSQEKRILLLDANTRKPVPFASVCVESENEKNYCVSEFSGTFSFTPNYPSVIAISALGYKTHLDTLLSQSDTVIFLQPSVFDLDEVIFTGQVSPRKSEQSVYKVTVMNRQEIEQKAAQNLSGLLNNELNINLSQQGVLGKTLSINGLSGEHIKILVDGIPVSGRQNGIIDLDQLNLNSIDHIEIIEGPLSVLYGSNALGGVINLITRKKSDDKFSAGLKSLL